MAITARELVFFIRAENQASGVLRKVARDLRALPSTKQLKVSSAAADQTVRQVNSGQRVISLAKQELDLKGKSLATQKALVDAQLRQATIAQKYNSVQAAKARNAQAITRTQVRVDSAYDKLQSMPQAAADLQSANTLKQRQLQQQIDANRKAVKDAEQSVADAQSSLRDFPTQSVGANRAASVARQQARIEQQLAENQAALRAARANVRQIGNRQTLLPNYEPAQTAENLTVAKQAVKDLKLQEQELTAQLDEVRIKAAEAAKTLTDGMEKAQRSLASAEESLALVSNQTEILSEKEIQLAKDATAAGEAQVRAAQAAVAAYEIAGAQLELYRVKQLELANAERQVQLKAEAEALAIRSDIYSASAARINVITQAFNKMGRTAQIAGLLVGAAVGVAAHSAAGFESQTTLAATQARPIGAPISSTANIQVQLNKVILDQMKQFPAASKDMADSLYEIFSGTNVQNVKKASDMLRVFNMMAVAGGTDLKTMTDVGISLYNNFPHEFKTMTDAANAFFAAVRYGRTTPAQLAGSLALVLPVAKAAGRTFKDVADAMALVTRQTGGKYTTRDATGLARLIEMFSNKDVMKGLQLSGINTEESSGKLKPILTLITDIYNKFVATGKLKPGPDTLNFFKTISALGSGGAGTAGTIQGRREFDQLITNIKAYAQVSKQVNSDKDEFTKSFNALSQSPGVKWAILTNQLKALVIVIGEQAIPAFMKIGEPIVNLLKWFNSLSDATKKDIGQWLVYGSIGGIFVGFLIRISSGIARFILLRRLMTAANETGDLAKLSSQSGLVSGKMALMLGPLGLIIGAFILWPHQTMAVINALGGLKTILTVITLLFIGMKLGTFFEAMIAGWRAATAAAGIAATAITAVAGAEGAATVGAAELDVALAPLIGPAELIGALVGIVAAFILLGNHASLTAKAVKDLKKAIDDTATARLKVPQLNLNLDEAENQLAEAKKALGKTTVGTLQWKEAVDNVKDALTGVADAQSAIKTNQNNINKGLETQLINVLKIAAASKAKNKPPNPLQQLLSGAQDILHLPHDTSTENASSAAKNFADNVDKVAVAEAKVRPLYSRNLLLIGQMTRAIGHIPPEKTLRMLLDNKKLDAQLKDFINQMPAEYKKAIENSGSIMGVDQADAWLNAMQSQFDNNPLSPPKIDTSKLPNKTKNIPDLFTPAGMKAYHAAEAADARAAAAKAAATATNNSAYLTALHKVGNLQTIADRDKPGTPQWLADTSAFNAALAALNKSYKNYQDQTSSYLSAVESANTKAADDTVKKAKTAAEKAAAAAKKAASDAAKAWTAAATTLQSAYSSMFSTNQTNFGTLFQGPFVNSPGVQNRLQWGGKLSGNDLLMDLKSQVKQFRDYNNMVKKLARMKNVPFALVQQLEAAGPAAIDQVRALLSLPKSDLQSYFKTYKQGQNLVEQVTQDQFKLDVSHYKTLGKNIALAIIQGLQSVGTPDLKWFENLIKSWFPALAKAAKDVPAAKTTGSLKGLKTPKGTPKKAPKTPKPPHHTVTRRVASATNPVNGTDNARTLASATSTVKHMFVLPGKFKGLEKIGNLDLLHRKVAHLKNGEIATVRSASIGVDGKEILIPTVINGIAVSLKQAIEHWRKTGENLGTFDNAKDANTYAIKLHKEQAEYYALLLKHEKSKTSTDTKNNNQPVERHVHYHVEAPHENASIEAQLRRAHFINRTKYRLEKT